jgi:chromosome partitioning protein
MQTEQREHSIGDVARLLGVSRSWITKREEMNVLPVPRRTPGGHRTYTTEELHSIREIARSEGVQALEQPHQLPLAKRPKFVSSRIAVLNQKGGPGKTTIAQNLAFALGKKGFRCLLVDLDRQGSLTFCCGIDIRNEREKGLGHALIHARKGEDSPFRPILLQTYSPHVDIVPGNEGTYDAQLHFDAQREIAGYWLKRSLDPLSKEYDFTFIDCPPDLGTLTINGLVASDHILLPVDHNLSMLTIEHFEKTFDGVRYTYNNSLDLMGVVMNKYDARTTNSRSMEEDMVDLFGPLLFQTRIAQSSKVPESQKAGRAVVDYDPRCSASVQFADLAEEVLQRTRERARLACGAES